MITAFQLIFSPFQTWERITTAQRGIWWVMFVHLAPLLLVLLGLEALALTRWGEKTSELGFVVNVPGKMALRYAVAYGVLLLAAILLSAQLLTMASQSFNVRTTFYQSFVVMAYGFGPIILARLLDGLPQLNTWVCWAIGTAVSVSVLYHGIGMVLRPDQTKGFGLYLISIIIVVLTGGLSHFAALGVLHGKILQPRNAQAVPVTEIKGLVDSTGFLSGGAVRVRWPGQA